MSNTTIIQLWKKSELIGGIGSTVDMIICYTTQEFIEQLDKVKNRTDYDAFTVYKAEVILEGTKISY